MKHLKRSAVTFAAVAAILFASVAPASAATSSWYNSAGSYLLTVGGCPSILGVYPIAPQHRAIATEDGACAGNIGVQARYYATSSSPTVTLSSIIWGASSARINVGVLVGGRVHH